MGWKTSTRISVEATIFAFSIASRSGMHHPQ